MTSLISSLDFVDDQFACDRRFRVLNIVDDVTQECLGCDPRYIDLWSSGGRELADLISRRGKPGMIVSDRGTQFTSNAILAYSKDHRVECHYIATSRGASRCRTAMSNPSAAECRTNS
jgi:transposase InsO family protein